MNALIPTNTTDMLAIAQQMAMSNMFSDAKKAEEAFVKILAGAEMGLAPFQAMTGIHVIQGKPVVGAGLMAAMVKRSGKYDYRVLEQSTTICKIEFFQGPESIGVSTFTIEDAKKAQVKNLDKFAANMLFARAMSNGVKWYTPDVFNGPVYTEGEIEAPTVVDTTAEVLEAQPTRPTKRDTAESMKAQMDATRQAWLDSIHAATDLDSIEHARKQLKASAIEAGMKKELSQELVRSAMELGFGLVESEEKDTKGNPVMVFAPIATASEAEVVS